MFETLFGLETIIASPPLLYGGVFVLGAIIGSFLNVLILRLPPLLEHDWHCQCRELLLPIETPNTRHRVLPLHCPKCGHGIKAWENIPLLSFIFCADAARPAKRAFPGVTPRWN
jgi:leader peptidase (prepilin peptidase)/N-methyltransferase